MIQALAKLAAHGGQGLCSTSEIGLRAKVLGQDENHYYGHLKTLSAFSGRNIRVTDWKLAHSTFVENHPHLLRQKKVLCWSSADAHYLQCHGVKAEAIGAPFLYRSRLSASVVPASELSPMTCQTERAMTCQTERAMRDVLYFVSHGWEKQGTLLNHADLADYLFDRFGVRVVVVLYYHDFDNRLTHEAYTRRGLKVIKLGNSKCDPLAMDRQFSAIQAASEVGSDSFTTALLYACSLGKKVQIHGPGALPNWDYGRVSKVGEVLRQGIAEGTAEEFGKRYLGYNRLLEPSALGQLLEPSAYDQIFFTVLATGKIAKRSLSSVRHKLVSPKGP